MSITANQQTAKHWDSDPWNTGQVVFWLQHPSVQRRLAIKESGRADGNWIDHTLEAYFAGRLPLARCLSLGCGRGRVEMQWAARQAFVACDAYDISPGSIADALADAEAAGYANVHFGVADINQIELSPQAYDAAWAVGSAHHFSALEHIFSQVATALKPGGLFILHEYVGPNRFQFPPYQRQVIQACLDLLPPATRRLVPAGRQDAPKPHLAAGSHLWRLANRGWDKLRHGELRSAVKRGLQRVQAPWSGSPAIKLDANLPTLHSVIAVDPSEAVRSAEIVPVLSHYFDIVEHKPLGGTILQFLLADIAGNFAGEDGAQLLEMLFDIEDTLLACGDLSSDFAYIVARPKPRQIEDSGGPRQVEDPGVPNLFGGFMARGKE